MLKNGYKRRLIFLHNIKRIAIISPKITKLSPFEDDGDSLLTVDEDEGEGDIWNGS